MVTSRSSSSNLHRWIKARQCSLKRTSLDLGGELTGLGATAGISIFCGACGGGTTGMGADAFPASGRSFLPPPSFVRVCLGLFTRRSWNSASTVGASLSATQRAGGPFLSSCAHSNLTAPASSLASPLPDPSAKPACRHSALNLIIWLWSSAWAHRWGSESHRPGNASFGSLRRQPS